MCTPTSVRPNAPSRWRMVSTILCRSPRRLRSSVSSAANDNQKRRGCSQREHEQTWQEPISNMSLIRAAREGATPEISSSGKSGIRILSQCRLHITSSNILTQATACEKRRVPKRLQCANRQSRHLMTLLHHQHIEYPHNPPHYDTLGSRDMPG
jgi:hypothetical protein